MNFLQKINATWQKVGLVQRALLTATLMACIITAVLLAKWATRPDMRLLFGGLGLEEAAKIVDKIFSGNTIETPHPCLETTVIGIDVLNMESTANARATSHNGLVGDAHRPGKSGVDRCTIRTKNRITIQQWFKHRPDM